MDMKQAIARVIERRDLNAGEMTDVMRAIMTGGATPAQIGGFLVGLRMKGETVTEIAAAAGVMRELASGVDIRGLDHTVDIVGTGGDASGTFNVSTASMFVAAAAGCHVAKHGNRSVSSKSGCGCTRDRGLRLTCRRHRSNSCVREVGVGFMFAPGHHSAMKRDRSAPRNGRSHHLQCAGAADQSAGRSQSAAQVFSDDLLEPLAEVLRKLGSRRVMVVHSRDGLDEISIGDQTEVAELKDGMVRRLRSAEDFGLHRSPLDSIPCGRAAGQREDHHRVLDDTPGPARDIVVLNAGAAIYVAGLADSLKDGVKRPIGQSRVARRAIDSTVCVLTQGFD